MTKDAPQDALQSFYEGVMECAEDTWQCACGRTEPWWTESNADYATRDARAILSARPPQDALAALRELDEKLASVPHAHTDACELCEAWERARAIFSARPPQNALALLRVALPHMEQLHGSRLIGNHGETTGYWDMEEWLTAARAILSARESPPARDQAPLHAINDATDRDSAAVPSQEGTGESVASPNAAKLPNIIINDNAVESPLHAAQQPTVAESAKRISEGNGTAEDHVRVFGDPTKSVSAGVTTPCNRCGMQSRLLRAGLCPLCDAKADQPAGEPVMGEYSYSLPEPAGEPDALEKRIQDIENDADRVRCKLIGLRYDLRAAPAAPPRERDEPLRHEDMAVAGGLFALRELDDNQIELCIEDDGFYHPKASFHKIWLSDLRKVLIAYDAAQGE